MSTMSDDPRDGGPVDRFGGRPGGRPDDWPGDGRDDFSGDTARLERGLRELAARPPHLAPRAAAAAIERRIAERENPRRRLQLRLAWGLATACLLALVITTAGTLTPRPAPAPLTVAGLVPPSTTLGEGQVLIWLDERTPLYMNFAPPSPAGGGTPVGGGS